MCWGGSLQSLIVIFVVIDMSLSPSFLVVKLLARLLCHNFLGISHHLDS